MTIPEEPTVADIPVIDLAPLHDKSAPPAAIDAIVDEIREACINTGFFQIINHGVSPTLQQSVFQASKRVFELPTSEKLALKRDPFGNRGYEILEGQALDGAVEGHKRLPSEYVGMDMKEGYYVGKERKAGDPMLTRRFNGLNKWPPGIEEFPPVMTEYYDTMYGLALEVMELIALLLL
jgi:isopenicillin N synthase-like dioxygenase